jgi:TRAP-type uncharacterized transport system substrate-binding protein
MDPGTFVMSSTRWRLKIAAGLLGLLLVGVAIFNYCRVYCCAPVELTLSGGNVCPLRSEMARHICGEVHDAGVLLQCATGTNSESICAGVDNGELDLGLVLGGFPAELHPNVRQVAALGVEPLHLLVRPELLKGKPASLEPLRGRRVSLGEHGTNGAMLAESLMRFAGLKPTTPDSRGDFIAEYSRECDLHLALTALQCAADKDKPAFAAKLPDAVFLVDSLPAPLVDELVTIGGYQLVPLPYATALHLDVRRDHAHAEGRLASSRLEEITIPAYTYGIDPPTPPEDCPTFGLRLLLVAHKDTPRNAVLRLLRALDGGVAARYHIDLDAANEHHEFPIHPGAGAFAEGRRPMMVGELLEPAGDLLSVIGAGGAGALALWGFMRGLRRIQPDVHLRQIDRIERLLQGSEQDESAPTLPREFIDHLESRLAEVKQTAIEDYATGRLDSDEALVGILTLIADTRHMLVQRRKQLGQQELCAPARPTRLSDAA